MAKYGKKASEKIRKTMHEFKQGTLKSGSGQKVKSREQAIAIAISQARRAGAKVPRMHHATKKSPARLQREIDAALTRFVAIDPKTGRHLREATKAEREKYLRQPTRGPAFRTPVRVGKVIVDEYTGPGIWHGGAGF